MDANSNENKPEVKSKEKRKDSYVLTAGAIGAAIFVLLNLTGGEVPGGALGAGLGAFLGSGLAWLVLEIFMPSKAKPKGSPVFGYVFNNLLSKVIMGIISVALIFSAIYAILDLLHII